MTLGRFADGEKFGTPAGGMGMMERKDGVWNEKAVTLTVENEKSADLL